MPLINTQAVSDVRGFGAIRFAASQLDPSRLPGVKILLEAGAEVNAVNAESLTPLIKAVQGKSMSMVATLLDAGADQAQKKDSRGWQVRTSRWTAVDRVHS